MYLDRYEYFVNKDFLSYEFFSEGPKGKIKKIIRSTRRNAGGVTYFNLGFGDWYEKKKRMDDLVVSDNQDRQKILDTIGSAVLDFTAIFPDAIVYAKGSTAARNRSYQMGISAAKISDKVRDYGNDPFFVKKANKSKTFLEKHGFPKELLKIREE